MKSFKIIMATALSLVLLSSCWISGGVNGNGNVTTQKHKISRFDAMDVSGVFEVEITHGDEHSVSVETDENLHDLVQVKVENDELKVEMSDDVGDLESLILHVTTPLLEELSISGAVSVSTMNELLIENLSIDGSGASEVDMKLSGNSLSLDMSGASECNFRGDVHAFRAELSGASEVQAKSLRCKSVTIDISGAGSAVVNASEQLDCEISGAGSVAYKGTPRVTKDISGAGSISKL